MRYTPGEEGKCAIVVLSIMIKSIAAIGTVWKRLSHVGKLGGATDAGINQEVLEFLLKAD